MPDHVDPVAWGKLSLFEQMGNIGSEVGRTMNALGRDDDASALAASQRALDLIDITVGCWSSEGRRRELLRARELFTSAVQDRRPDRALDAYFFQYALAARTQRPATTI